VSRTEVTKRDPSRGGFSLFGERNGESRKRGAMDNSRWLCWWHDLFARRDSVDPGECYLAEITAAERDFQALLGVWLKKRKHPNLDELLDPILSFVDRCLRECGDLQLGKKVPAPAALEAYDLEARKLVEDVKQHKWLRNLRRFALVDQPGLFTQRMAEKVSDVRMEFEELVWRNQEARSPSLVSIPIILTAPEETKAGGDQAGEPAPTIATGQAETHISLVPEELIPAASGEKALDDIPKLYQEWRVRHPEHGAVADFLRRRLPNIDRADFRKATRGHHPRLKPGSDVLRRIAAELRKS
jgi:hypothetical protein